VSTLLEDFVITAMLLTSGGDANLVVASWLGHQRLRHLDDAIDIWW
jgi:hypothetical protein